MGKPADLRAVLVARLVVGRRVVLRPAVEARRLPLEHQRPLVRDAAADLLAMNVDAVKLGVAERRGGLVQGGANLSRGTNTHRVRWCLDPNA